MMTPMTRRKPARTAGAGLPGRAVGPTTTPRRLTTMTANDSTPTEGQDSTDSRKLKREYGVPPTETTERTAQQAKLELVQERAEAMGDRLMGVALRDDIEGIEQTRAELRHVRTDLAALLELLED